MGKRQEYTDDIGEALAQLKSEVAQLKSEVQAYREATDAKLEEMQARGDAKLEDMQAAIRADMAAFFDDFKQLLISSTNLKSPPPARSEGALSSGSGEEELQFKSSLLQQRWSRERHSAGSGEEEISDLLAPPKIPKSLLLPENRPTCDTKLPEDCHYQPENLVPSAECLEERGRKSSDQPREQYDDSGQASFSDYDGGRYDGGQYDEGSAHSVVEDNFSILVSQPRQEEASNCREVCYCSSDSACKTKWCQCRANGRSCTAACRCKPKKCVNKEVFKY